MSRIETTLRFCHDLGMNCGIETRGILVMKERMNCIPKSGN